MKISKILILLLALTTKTFSVPDGTLDSSFGTNNGTTIQQIPVGTRTIIISIAIDTDGTIVVAGINIIPVRPVRLKWQVARFSPDGKTLLKIFDDPFPTLPVGFNDSEPFALAIQADGKIVVTGFILNSPVMQAQMATVRYTSDGKLDKPNFGDSGSGIVLTSYPGNSISAALSIAIQSDGKIVIAGETGQNINNNLDFIIARYTTSGQLDTTNFNEFGIKPGTITASFLPNFPIAGANGVAIQADGTIIATGMANNNIAPFTSAFAIARFDSQGNPIAQFTDSLNLSYSGFNGGAVIIQSDGKIVIGGSAAIGTNNNQFVVARYSSNPTSPSSKDTTFNFPNGYNFTTFPDGQAFYDGIGGALVIQSNGKIVIGGEDQATFALARFTSSGALDTTTFGTNGMVTTSPANFSTLSTTITATNINALALQQNGDIIAAGGAGANNGPFGALARYNNTPNLFLPTLDPVTDPSVLSGHAQNLSFLTVSVDGTPVCTSFTQPNTDPTQTNGAWSCNLATPLTPGSHTVDIVSLYKPANVNLDSGPIPVNIPGVSLIKSGPNTILAGSFLDYTITVSNQGLPETNIQITDQLPPEVTFVSASGAPFTRSGQTITFTIPTLTTGTPVTLKIRVKVANLTSSTVITNTVTTPNVAPQTKQTEVIALVCNLPG